MGVPLTAIRSFTLITAMTRKRSKQLPAHSISIPIYSGIARFPLQQHGFLFHVGLLQSSCMYVTWSSYSFVCSVCGVLLHGNRSHERSRPTHSVPYCRRHGRTATASIQTFRQRRPANNAPAHTHDAERCSLARRCRRINSQFFSPICRADRNKYVRIQRSKETRPVPLLMSATPPGEIISYTTDYNVTRST